MITTKSIVMEPITLNKKVKVYLTTEAHSVKTGKRQAGDVVELHEKQAEDWIKSGKATEKSESKTQKGGQK